MSLKKMNEILDSIEHKANMFRLQSSLSYKGNAEDMVPYKEKIVTNDKYPDFYFLVTENMIFSGSGSLKDSSYNVLSFNKDGIFIRQEDVAELGKEFFRSMKILKELEQT